jgi:hypothetical protein
VRRIATARSAQSSLSYTGKVKSSQFDKTAEAIVPVMLSDVRFWLVADIPTGVQKRPL